MKEFVYWSLKVTKKSIHFPKCLSNSGLEAVLADWQGTPWTGQQAIAGLTHS